MELAKALGTTQRVISYYETKGELPPPDVLVAPVRTLGASADELLGLKSSKIRTAEGRSQTAASVEEISENGFVAGTRSTRCHPAD